MARAIKIEMHYKPTVKNLKQRLKKVKGFADKRQAKVLLNDIARAAFEAIDYAFGTGGSVEAREGKLYQKKKWMPNDETTRKWKMSHGFRPEVGQQTGMLVNQIPRGNTLKTSYFSSRIHGYKLTMSTLVPYVDYFNSGLGARQPARPFTPTQSVLDNLGTAAIQKRWKKYMKKGMGAI